MPETVAGEELFEVWLVEHGHFIIIDHLPDNLRNDPAWMDRMSRHRRLRLYLPAEELPYLEALRESVDHYAFERKRSMTTLRMRTKAAERRSVA